MSRNVYDASIWRMSLGRYFIKWFSLHSLNKILPCHQTMIRDFLSAMFRSYASHKIARCIHVTFFTSSLISKSSHINIVSWSLCLLFVYGPITGSVWVMWSQDDHISKVHTRNRPNDSSAFFLRVIIARAQNRYENTESQRQHIHACIWILSSCFLKHQLLWPKERIVCWLHFCFVNGINRKRVNYMNCYAIPANWCRFTQVR